MISGGAEAVFALYSDAERRVLETYAGELERAAAELLRVHVAGRLECGLRAFLAPVFLFHWNRIALSSSLQWGLARAAANEFARLTQKGAD